MQKLWVLLIAIMLVLLQLPSTARANAEDLIHAALRGFNYVRVLELAERIALMGSRAPGYPGFERVLQLILDEVRVLNLSYTLQNFTMLAPVEVESYVEILEPQLLRLKAYSLWPHAGIAAGSGVKEGLLVYVGKGSLEEFDGKLVNGSIVVMEYDGSGSNWLNALRFGAKAVIYLGGGNPQREALSKFDPIVPVPFMRLYLEPGEAAVLRELLRKGLVRAKVFTDMELRDVSGYNVLVEIPGSEKRDEIIMFTAHFDAWCVAPALANSTEQAISTAALIELMRYLAENRPPRTTWLLFTSGHWNGLAGPRYFIEHFILRRPDLLRGEKTIWYIMGLDISADVPTASLIYVGHFYLTARPFITVKYYPIQRIASEVVRIVEDHLEAVWRPSLGSVKEIPRHLGLIRFMDLTDAPGLMWSSTMAKPFVLDTEPFVVAGMAAFTMRTSYSFRPFEGEPVSDLQYVRSLFADRVVPQLASMCALAVGLLSEPIIGVMKSSILPTRLHPLFYWGFVTLQVQVLQYNITQGWYRTVPHAIVRVGRWSTYPFAWILARADSNGTALIHGVTPSTLNSWYIEAWKFAGDNLIVAPAFGMRSFGSTWVSLIVSKGYTSVYVMPLHFRVLLDLCNPRLMRRTYDDPRYASSNAWVFSGVWPSLYEASTGIVPLYTSVSLNDRSGIALSSYSYISELAITIGIGARWPAGVASGDALVLWALNYAKDTYLLAEERYSVLKEKEVRKLSAELMLSYAKEHLNKSIDAIKRLQWSMAYSNALAAWSYAARAYSNEVMPLYVECLNSTILITPFIAATSYFIEKLLLRSAGLKSMINILALEILLFTLFAFVHPAFWVIPGTILAVLSIGLLILTAIIVLVFYRETKDFISEYTAQLLGKHEVAKERMAIVMMAMSLSIENMRRRPLRTALTLMPIAVLVMAMVSLTSISPYTAVSSRSIERSVAPFYGFVLKRSPAREPWDMLDLPAVEMLKAIVGDAGYVSSRLVYYSPSVLRLGPFALALSNNASIQIPAVIGLSPEGAYYLMNRTLIKGLPRPFIDEHQLAVLLPSSIAEKLKVDIGDEIELYGMKLVVTGIFSERAMSAITDPDGWSLAPTQSVFYWQYHGFSVPLPEGLLPIPYSWDEIVILPSGVVRKLGGAVYSIDVILKQDVPESEFRKLAEKIVYSIDTRCLGGDRNLNSFDYFLSITYAIQGWDVATVILFSITTLSIVTSLIGNIQERTREFFIFSSVGLSPNGAMLMVIAEFSTYSLLGGTVGYFAGWGISKLMRTLGVLPGTFVFNYASISIAFILIIAFLSSLIASVYPARIASRIITPSLERRWKIPKPSRGTAWEIPFPFRVYSEKEVYGLLLYLYEYFTGTAYEKRYYKIEGTPILDFEAKRIRFNMSLYPFEEGTEQEVNISFIEERKEVWRAIISLHFLKGLHSIWVGASQYYFLDDLRKQLLLWGTLASSERAKYIREALENLREGKMSGSSS